MNIFQYFYRPGSRKVSFGILLFLVACGAFFGYKLPVDDFMTCVFLSSALIGGGTVADAYFKTRSVPGNDSTGKAG